MDVSIAPSCAPSSDFPSDVLKWMKANSISNPKLALKLMKCHRCFQHSCDFPYLVVKEVFYFGVKWRLTFLNDKIQQYQNFDGLKNITKMLWITESLILIGLPNLSANFIPKIAVCEVKALRLEQENITFDEFKYLTASETVEHLDLSDEIYFQDSDSVVIADILKCVPNVKTFHFFNDEIPVFSPSNFIDSVKDIDVSKLEFFGLHITSYSNFLIFLKFIKQNPHIQYRVHFSANSLTSKEAGKVKKYVRGIIKGGITEFPPPLISFHARMHDQSTALYSLFEQYYENKK